MIVLMRLLLLAAVSIWVIQAAPAMAAECLGVKFDDSIKMGSQDLVLNGLGIRKASIVAVKVYVAGLYVPKKTTDGAQIINANQPWKLELRFVRDAGVSDIRDAFTEGFKKAAGGNLSALNTRISDLNARMIDFKQGYVLSYAYNPASGTLIDVNGARGVAIPGADFAAALLKIFIGPEPPNKDLKSGLLGGKCE